MSTRPNSREALTANGYPLKRGWMTKDTNKGGRPSKEAIRKEAAQIASEQAQVNDDFQRLMRVQ
jgi:hypothetical protein